MGTMVRDMHADDLLGNGSTPCLKELGTRLGTEGSALYGTVTTSSKCSTSGNGS